MSHILENEDFQCMLKTYCYDFYDFYEGILGTHLIWLYSKCGNIVVLCLERFFDLFMNTLRESKNIGHNTPHLAIFFIARLRSLDAG